MPPTLQRPSLRKLYGDICRGYTVVSWHGQEVYVKHLCQTDYAEIDDAHDRELAQAQEQGLLTRKEKEKWLMSNKLWSDKEERELIQQKDYIDNMEKTRLKLAFKSQIEEMKKSIAVERQRYDEMVEKKEKLFGVTAETYADRKNQFLYISTSFFRDEDLKDKLFTAQDMNEMYDDDSYELLGIYITIINDFKIEHIRKISIAPYFANALHLCGENLSLFFSKPIWSLTLYQSNLLSSGNYFRSITKGETLPDDIKEDPDKIEEFVVKAQNIKDMMTKTAADGGSTGWVGASADDFSAANVKDDRSFTKEGEYNLFNELKGQ